MLGNCFKSRQDRHKNIFTFSNKLHSVLLRPLPFRKTNKRLFLCLVISTQNSLIKLLRLSRDVQLSFAALNNDTKRNLF